MVPRGSVKHNMCQRVIRSVGVPLLSEALYVQSHLGCDRHVTKCRQSPVLSSSVARPRSRGNSLICYPGDVDHAARARNRRSKRITGAPATTMSRPVATARVASWTSEVVR